MFLFKMVEGFCKVWAKSYDDRRAFVSYYVPVDNKAALQIKMLRATESDTQGQVCTSQRLTFAPANTPVASRFNREPVAPHR
jgi:hypothetical protein